MSYPRVHTTQLQERQDPTGDKKRSAVLAIVRDCIRDLCDSVPTSDASANDPDLRFEYASRSTRHAARSTSSMLFIDASDFPREGPHSAAIALVAGYEAG